MKRLIIFAFFKSFSLSEPPNELFDQANKLYIQESYIESIKLYENILENNKGNSKIYYNLGNAYFRINKVGLAIWSYKNALRLNPRNKDISYNLTIAENYKVDRVTMPYTSFLLEKYRQVRMYLTADEWKLFGSLLFFALALNSLFRKMAILKNRFSSNISQVLIIFIISVHILILDKYSQEKKSYDEAIFIKKTNALSGPLSDNHQILFEVNEGSLAEILRVNDDWVYIILLDGNTGWVKSETIRFIK
ncbi:MAG: hypothetical protein CMG55_08475 [Candidatus Marinimicrobia bacterium]|nr:hypothetical protein [Candidatus Neomarinimicrobiota bacterium]|tara:strand:- start:4393 stop:5139 length:747 start_codon:yes stop_codon:yes gene_type:complete